MEEKYCSVKSECLDSIVWVNKLRENELWGSIIGFFWGKITCSFHFLNTEFSTNHFGEYSQLDKKYFVKIAII